MVRASLDKFSGCGGGVPKKQSITLADLLVLHPGPDSEILVLGLPVLTSVLPIEQYFYLYYLAQTLG